jgi:O-antigen ligase
MYRASSINLMSKDRVTSLSSPYNSMLVISLLGLVFGGIFKALFLLASVNLYDLTILSAISILLLLIMQFKFNVNRDGIYLVLILGFFSFTYISSYLYSPSSVYGPQKFLGFLGVLFSFFVGLALPAAARNLFLSVIPSFGIVIALAFILIMTSNLQALLTFDFSGVGLVAGEILGIGVIISIFMPDQSILKKLSMLLSVVLMVFLGARGPLVFLILIGSFIALMSIGKNFSSLAFIRKETIYFIIFAISSIIALFMILAGGPLFEFLESGFSRFLLLFQSDKGDSINSRMQMISDAILYIDQAPILGHGMGSYGLVVYGEDFRAYPHNGFLEIWFEGGILCLLLFIAFILMSVFTAIKRKNVLLAFIIIFLMLNFFKSSSLDELRLLFLICGLSAGVVDKEKGV